MLLFAVAQPSTADMDGCRVVGPRGLCRPLDEKRGFPTSHPGRAGQGRAGQGAGQAGQGRQARGLGGRQGRAGLPKTVGHFLGKLLTVRASVGASSAHANGQRRSRQFRVGGFFSFFKGLFLFRRRSREPRWRQATNQLP